MKTPFQFISGKFFLIMVVMLQSCQAQPDKETNKEQSMESKSEEGLFAELQTNMGNILIQLEFEKTPLTVANFVGLAEGTKNSNKAEGTPFYNGVIFHRIIKGFMIQGGDPDGTGMGGPGYKFPDEFHPDLKHSGPGILSMANAGPGTNGSQFFITHAPTPHLDGRHTVFGHVVGGMDVVDAIASVKTGGQDRPVEPVVMEKVVIKRIGEKAEAFKCDQASFDSLLKSHKERQMAAMKERDKELFEGAKTDTEKYLGELEKSHPGKIKTTESGLKYVVVKEGSGEKPKAGSNIKVHYTGKFVDGRKFDSSVDRGQPIEFPVGMGRVIEGWDEALLDMKKGEKRILVIPYDLAYGENGRGPIPPYATLVFDVELISL